MPGKSSRLDTKKILDAIGTMHNCKLPEEEPLYIMYISTGYCISLRRYLRKKTLVNPNNKTAKNLFLSVAAFKKETENHLKRSYFMFHPYSEFKMFWETCMIVIVLISLFYYPSLIYVDSNTIHNNIIKGFFSCVFLLDIMVNFNTGYFSSDASRVIMNRRQVSIHYLKTYFFLDLICLLNLNRLLITEMLYTTLNYITVVRISMIVRYIPGFTEFTQVTFYRFHFTKLVLITLVIIWWATSFLYLLCLFYPESWLKDVTKHGKAITCFYRVNYLIFLLGFGEEHSTHDAILIFEIICWIAGTILRIFSFAEVFQIVSKYGRSGRNTYHQRTQRLKLMMQRRRLPQETRTRILQYFDFRFQKNYFKEDEILSCFSKQLRDEVLGYNCRKLIENADIFDHLPSHIVESMIRNMKMIIYLRNDIIVKANSPGGSMFFVHDGAVALYSAEGIEVCHVSDGQCFGERAMILNDMMRMATVVAIDACELYVLYSTDFENIMDMYDFMYETTKKKVIEKYDRLKESGSKELYAL